jgi:alpha-methylacyl-CoA racemase
MGPLNGLTIIEIAGIGPGPFAAMLLADMGANVIRVERPGGSMFTAAHNPKLDFLNRGKRCISVNLKNPDGVATVLDLVEKADGLLEGNRPGVMERLGLGPEVCLERNKRLVYGRPTGWGQTGPLSQVAGHDPNYISLTGTLYHSGSPNQPPQAPATLLGDAAGGAALFAWGISSALIPAIRDGIGQVIDAAVVDGTAYLSTFARSFYQAGHMNDARGSDWMDGAAPWNRAYQCADGGYITLCPVEARFYQVLLEKLELSAHSLFSDCNQWDKARWPDQVEYLQNLFASQSRQHWCDLLEGTDACFAPVLNYGEVHEHPHNRARNSYQEVDGQWHPQPAPRFSETVTEPAWEDSASQDTQEILRNLGVDGAQLAAAGFNSHPEVH